jgi:DNA repair protein RadC
MHIIHPYLFWKHLRRVMKPDCEEFWAAALTADKQLLRTVCLFRGTVDSCLIHPRDLFRFAVLENASALIIAHNHPSQNKEPSLEDIQVNKKLIQAAKIMQIPILDHLIITNEGYSSFLDKGLMKY